jgi:bacteriocin-like protein
MKNNIKVMNNEELKNVNGGFARGLASIPIDSIETVPGTKRVTIKASGRIKDDPRPSDLAFAGFARIDEDPQPMDLAFARFARIDEDPRPMDFA